MFGVVWAAAIVGIVLNAIDVKKFSKVSMVCYLAMGWVVIFAIKPLVHSLPLGGVILLAAGGVLYTGGVAFYALNKIHYMHSVWHLFVLGGSICQYLSIALYVIPATF